MSQIAYMAASFSSGVAVTSMFLVGVHRRLVARAIRHERMENVANNIESRRMATDFGIDEMPRPGSGPDADESNLFEVRPGAMHLAHLATKRGKKVSNQLDPQQNPTTLD